MLKNSMDPRSITVAAPQGTENDEASHCAARVIERGALFFNGLLEAPGEYLPVPLQIPLSPPVKGDRGIPAVSHFFPNS